MRKHLARNIIISIVCFGIVFVGVFFGVQYFTKTGIFRIPGIVIYDETLNGEEISLFNTIFTKEIDLDKNVTISARNELSVPALNDGEFLYSIKVPVTDFYSLDDNITVTSADSALENANYSFIDINSLDHTKRLLSINGKYYLDEFTSGGIYRIITFESELYKEEIEPLILTAMRKVFPSKDTVLTFAQTGVTALSRGMNRKLNQVGDATYFAENIKDYLSSFDLTHTSNESSFTDFASSENICSDKRFIDTLTVIGLDIVELTGNHNQDCGDQAALETIDTYNENGIKIVGGGKTASEARVPLNISLKNNNFTMLAFNESTGGATYDDTPGANQYDAGIAANQIAEAKARGDAVIVDIQYFECNAYASEYEDATCDAADSSAGDQIGLFRELIDMGADVVVGTSAHQAQTYEVYNNGVIYYGLGNLFFDQIWWPGTTRSLILAHYFYNNKLVQTRIVPTVYDSNMQTRLLDEEASKWWLNRLLSVRP
jgi:poly-gamma-glutamate capsule biosynthesis protein CapA/YwtB (metallophosphatase superfamily)